MKKFLFLFILPLVFFIKLDVLAAPNLDSYPLVYLDTDSYLCFYANIPEPYYFIQNGDRIRCWDGSRYINFNYQGWYFDGSFRGAGAYNEFYVWDNLIYKGTVYHSVDDIPPPTFYDSSIQMGVLWHTSLKTNDNGYAWVNVGIKPLGSSATDILVTLRVNGVTKESWHENALGGIHMFDYASLNISNGDSIEIYATPYDENNNWGDSKSISWYANVNSGSVNIIDVPNLTPTVNGNPVTINPEPVVKYQGTTSTIVQTTTVYTQNTTIVNNGLTEEELQNFIDSIQTNITNYYGDTVNNIVTNNYYNYTYNYFSDDDSNENRLQTYNNTKESLNEWTSEFVSSLGVLVGTPFYPIFKTVVTVLGIIIACALLFVIIKIVGLIL